MRWIRLLPRPTRSTSLILVLAVLLELLGRLIHSTGVTIAAAAGVGAVIGDWILTPGAALEEVERRTPSRMAVGVKTSVQLSVMSRGGRLGGRRPIVLVDHAPGLDIGRYVTPSLREGERAIAERVATPLRRGCWPDGGRLELEAYSPLGGWIRKTTVRLPETGWIHPAPGAPLRLPDPVSGEAYGKASSAVSGSGVDFFGIREWRAGDARSAIHWRASARRNELVVVERERPGHPALLVAVGPLDSYDDDQERLLSRVASTVLHALRDGREVVLLADAASVAVKKPIDALDWFAAVDPEGAPPADALRAALLLAGLGAIVLWLGESALPEFITAAGQGAGAGSVLSARTLATRGLR